MRPPCAAQASHPSPGFGSQRTTNLAKLKKSLENSGDSLRAIVYSAAVLIFVVLLPSVLVRPHLLKTNLLTQEIVSLDDYIDGTVSRPFAYRVLLPQIMRGINAVTPASAAADLDRLGLRIASTGPQNKYPRDVIWLAALQFASLIGYALV